MQRFLFGKNAKSGRSSRGFTPSVDGQKTVLRKTLKVTSLVSLPIVFFFVALVGSFFEKMNATAAAMYTLFFLLPFGAAVLFVFVVTLVTLSVKQKKQESLLRTEESLSAGSHDNDVAESDTSEQAESSKEKPTREDFRFEKSTFKFKTNDSRKPD